MRDITRDTPSCPEDVMQLIPWYDDKQLSSEERSRIESHAAECAACRAEIGWMRGERAPEPTSVPSADAAYSRVRAKIEAPPVRLPSRRDREAPTSSAAVTDRWRRVAVAAGVVLALAAGVVAGRQWAAPGKGIYRVATVTADTARGPSLDILFRADVEAGRITDALRAIGGMVVSGPSKLGVYRVQLDGSDGEAAAKLLRGDGRGVATVAEVVP
jgi:anti-sigma factor RsiW